MRDLTLSEFTCVRTETRLISFKVPTFCVFSSRCGVKGSFMKAGSKYRLDEETRAAVYSTSPTRNMIPVPNGYYVCVKVDHYENGEVAATLLEREDLPPVIVATCAGPTPIGTALVELGKFGPGLGHLT
jgi:hypothetical protein